MTWPFFLVAFQMLGVALAGRPGVPGSRRLLASVISLMVPLAGPFLGMLVRHARGRGVPPPRERQSLRRPRMTAAGVNRLNRLPSVLDRLMSSDAAERLAAQGTLSTVGDATSIAVLRFTLEHGTTEVALDAALALEELGARREARREAGRRALREAPSFERALAVAEDAADAVSTHLGDGPGPAVMAATARAAYQVALELAPERWCEIAERLAQLELAAGRPDVALEQLTRIAAAVPGVELARLAPLRDRAAFAARRFETGLRLPTDTAGIGTSPAADPSGSTAAG